jgi:hypothetical protein
MKRTNIVLWTLVMVLSIVMACTQADGECWSPTEDNGQGGAAGGPLLPTGAGGFGDVPPRPQGATGGSTTVPGGCDVPSTKSCNEKSGAALDASTYAYCGDSCRCSGGVHGFSPSAFQFKTIIPDDGTSDPGGWQAAAVTLHFYRWTSLLPESWDCSFTVGMPLRTTLNGSISASYAATLAAEVATEAAAVVRDIKPELPPGIFCFKLISEMKSTFASTKYKSYGARVN